MATEDLTRVRKRKRDIDMTEGSILKNILRFALPLLLGNLFQQLYNMVDTWVIGQTGDNAAYSAVGSVGPITNILIGFFSGLASGAGVIISQYYGAKNKDKVQDAVHTAMAMTLVMAVLFTVLGLFLSPYILKLMFHAEEDVAIFDAANEYLTIYFSGVAALMIYNMGAGILRAVGDSDRPFYFLVISTVVNTVLDLLFVGVFHMGVHGVALATVTAQTVSAVLTLWVLLRSESCIRLMPRRLRMDFPILRKIVGVGIPAALQMALTAFSNVFVQSYIANVNGVHEYTLGGWTTYSKVDQFIFMPIQTLALSVTTFVGQNLGIGNVERAKKGVRVAFLCAVAITLFLILNVMLFAPYLAAVFNSDPNVVENAVILLRLITPFYLCSCVNQVLTASLRGAGNSRAPMIIMLSTFVGFRQLYLFVMSNFISNELIPIGMSYPAGWISCAICLLIYYFRFDFGKSCLTGD